MTLKDLERIVLDLAEEVAEMKERMRQFENVMTTAFGIIAEGGRPKKVLP